jgi:predicted nucleic acid-binding Zn ribbon protein
LRFPERINRILPRVFQNLDLEARMKNAQILKRWSEIVGEGIAQHARAAGVDAENLYIEVDNAVWQSQLFIMKERIIKRIRDFDCHIKDIKFTIGRSPRNSEESL